MQFDREFCIIGVITDRGAEKGGKMANLFNMDNPIWRFMGKLVDVCILTILWFACSLLWLPLTMMAVFGEQLMTVLFYLSCVPSLFFIGPSSTAVYYVTMKLVRDEDSYTTRSFIKSFKQNFVQGGIIGVIMTLLLAFFIYDIYAYFMMGSNLTFILGVLFIGIFIIYLITLVYVYPLQAKFYNKIRLTMRNAMFIGVKHIFRSLLMIAIAAAVVIGCLYFPPLILLSYGLIAFLQSYILVKIIDKYIPDQETSGNQDSIVAEAMRELEEMPQEEQEHIVITAPEPAEMPTNYFSRDMLRRTEPEPQLTDEALKTAGEAAEAAGEAAEAAAGEVKEAAEAAESAAEEAKEAAEAVEEAAGEAVEAAAEEVKEAAQAAESEAAEEKN